MTYSNDPLCIALHFSDLDSCIQDFARNMQNKIVQMTHSKNFLHQSLSTKEGPKSWRFAAWKKSLRQCWLTVCPHTAVSRPLLPPKDSKSICVKSQFFIAIQWLSCFSEKWTVFAIHRGDPQPTQAWWPFAYWVKNEKQTTEISVAMGTRQPPDQHTQP